MFGSVVEPDPQPDPELNAEIVTEALGDRVVVAPVGDLDVATVPALRAVAHRCIDRGARFVIVDLTKVDFLDSTALGALVSFHKRLRACNGRVVVVCPHRRLRRIFELTALDRVFTLTDVRSEALTVLPVP